jgi:hypothetical protein
MLGQFGQGHGVVKVLAPRVEEGQQGPVSRRTSQSELDQGARVEHVDGTLRVKAHR